MACKLVSREVRMYAKEHTVAECARHFGVSYSYMWNYAFDQDIVCKKAVRKCRNGERDRMIYELTKRYSYKEVGELYGITKQRVYQVVKRMSEKDGV